MGKRKEALHILHTGKRMLAGFLAAGMALSLGACGDEEGTAYQPKEYVYVPEFVELSSEDGSYYDAVLSGDYLYYPRYGWDEATQTSTYSIASVSVLDGSEGPEIPLDFERGSREDGGSRNIDNFSLDSQGNLYTLENVYHWDESGNMGENEYFLCQYNADGEKLNEVDISKQVGEENYLDNMALDGENRIYLAGQSTLYLFDAQGAYKGNIDLGESYIQNMGIGKDGVMCIYYYDNAGGEDSLREIDFDAKSLGNSYANFPSGHSNGGLAQGVEKDFLVQDGSRVYEYDKKTQTYEELFSWLDSDVNGANVNFMGVLGDGRIFAITSDWSGEEPSTELVLLTKKKSSEVEQKTVITLGCLYENTRIQSAAVKFNKSNDTYRISIRSYYDYNQVNQDNYEQVMNDSISRLNNDITSKNCPDMLVLDQLNVSQLAAKGVFEDLGAYLDASSVVNREDYLENAIECCTYGDVLVGIPKNFELRTVVGKTSEVGEKPGWTLDEMLAYAQEHPGAQLFDHSIKRDTIQFLVSYNQDAFIDWESGKCTFDTDTFKKVLEFANQFPEEYEYDEDEPSTPNKIAAGDVLLYDCNLYRFDEVQVAQAVFGEEPVTFIGYPNSDGGSGTYMTLDSLLAISSKSKNKEGAWEFLEEYLTYENEWYDFGFSTNKKKFAEQREEATTVEYVRDENGELVLDENGEPIAQGGGGGFSYGDGWEYWYHICTEEEADILEELAASARPVTDADTNIINIIMEEAEGYFVGQKSVDDVAGAIQNRVQLYVNENR